MTITFGNVIYEHQAKRYHPLYKIWNGMVWRCYNPKHISSKYYLEKGITVCQRWLDSFWSFVYDMGERPSKKHSIDRIDNNGNYEPANCKWSTDSEQQTNKSTTKRLVVCGVSKPPSAWAKEKGISLQLINHRKKSGLSVEESVCNPVKSMVKRYSLMSMEQRKQCLNKGLNPKTIYERLRRGKTFDEAISYPIKHEHGRTGPRKSAGQDSSPSK